jgi:selenocysteine lyase/cysteine desulfurase
LRAGLEVVDGVRVLDRGPRLCAIVTCALEGLDAADIVGLLREEAIATSALTPVSAIIDMKRRDVRTALRISPHYFNTEGEVDTVLDALAAIVGEARRTAARRP